MRLLFFLTIVFAISGPQAEARDTSGVSVSIKPLHALVSGVMAGTGTPHLIISGGMSPHAYSLKPSDMRKLGNARVVFWLGADMEPTLERALNSNDKLQIIRMTDNQHEDEENHEDEHEHKGHHHDPHVWLDPSWSAGATDKIAHVLSDIFPDNATAYQQNAQQLKLRLLRLDAELRNKLEPVRGRAFITYHDAFDHLARAYELNLVGSLTLSADRKPGARKMREIRNTIVEKDVWCVFQEPQFQPKLLDIVLEDLKDVRTGELDPIGAALEPGVDLYFELMRNNAQSLLDCLKR